MKALDKKNIEDILPLTPMQEGMLFHYLKDPGSEYYFEQLSLDISGEIDTQLFEKAWNFVIETNEMLRAVFRWEKVDNPVQIILKEHLLRPRYYDFSSMEVSEKKTHVEEIKTGDRKEKFDLRQVPFRVTFCKLDEEKYLVIISNHHILYDGWSNGIILKEFFNAYNDLANRRELIKPIKNKFREYVGWIRKQEPNRTFWENYLKGFDTQTELPVKQIRKGGEAGVQADYQIRFEKDVKEEIENFVKKYKITLASLLYGAWGLLLQRYNNSEDALFGTTISGRSAKLKGIEEIAGLFIHTLPLRVKAHDNEKIEDLLTDIHNTLQIRETYETTPLVEIRKFSELDSNEELFDTIVILENYPLNTRLMLNNSGLSVESYSLVETTHYDLVVEIMLFDKIEANFIYKRDTFDLDTIERLSDHFSGIVKNIVNNPGKKKSELEILPEEEKRKLLYEFNNTETGYPKDKSIQRLFDEQVERTPDNAALVGNRLDTSVVGEEKKTGAPIQLTYRELNRKANQLAYVLTGKGATHDTIVGIMVRRSIEMMVGILGILKAGAAYLPIDPEYPQERIDYMLTHSNVKVLLAAPAARVKEESIEIIDISKGFSSSTLTSTSSKVSSADLAYVIYTSGSTGNPKGVMINHQNVVNFIQGMAEKIDFLPGKTILALTTICFDIFVLETLLPLLKGLKVVIANESQQMDPDALEAVIIKNSVRMLQFTPSRLKLLLSSKEELVCLQRVTELMVGGEAFTPDLFAALKDRFNGRIYNLYGPTETTVWSTLKDLTGKEHVDIGSPISNTRVYILDKYNALQPVGVTGELCIAGDGVVRGYINNPGFTAGKFVDSPFEKEGRMYRTGDLARWQPDGNIECLGRQDNQVKIRGFRIELGEIESQLLKHKDIKEAVLQIEEDETGNKYLAAYIVSDGETKISQLRDYLRKSLPEYMIPTYFMPIEEIPLTPNGKIHRKALPSPEVKASEGYIAPGNETEDALAGIWSGVLGIEKEIIGIRDNFFQLGGHSLNAVIAVSRICKRFEVELSLGEFFSHAAIKELGSFLKTLKKSSYETVIPVEKRWYYPQSSAQKRLFFLDQFENIGTSYNIYAALEITGKPDKQEFAKTFKTLIARHEVLRTSFHLIDEEPVQRVHDMVDFEMEYYKYGESKQIEEIIEGFVRPFDLAKAPLLRAGVCSLPGNDFWLLFDIHHIISDGASVSILIDEFTSLYAGEKLPPVTLQYKDFSCWQNDRSQSGKIKNQERYWLSIYPASGEIPRLNFPCDYARPETKTFAGGVVSLVLGKADSEALNRLAGQEGATMYMVLLAIFYILLLKITRQEDIIIGTPAAGRRHADLEQVIGILMNTLALRGCPGSEKTFSQFLKEVKQNTIKAFENQDYSFEDLVEKVSLARNMSRNPLFDVIFDFVLPQLDAGAIPEEIAPGLKIKQHKSERRTAKVDFTFMASERDGRVNLSIEYSTQLYKQETMEVLLRHYEKIAGIVTANKEIKIRNIELIEEDESNEIRLAIQKDMEALEMHQNIDFDI